MKSPSSFLSVLILDCCALAVLVLVTLGIPFGGTNVGQAAQSDQRLLLLADRQELQLWQGRSLQESYSVNLGDGFDALLAAQADRRPTAIIEDASVDKHPTYLLLRRQEAPSFGVQVEALELMDNGAAAGPAILLNEAQPDSDQAPVLVSPQSDELTVTFNPGDLAALLQAAPLGTPLRVVELTSG